MGTYCYSRGDDVVEKYFETGKAPKYILVGKQKYYRDFGEEGVSVPSTTWVNPIHCVASGVAPSQAQELRDFYHKHGMNVSVDNDGNPIYTSKKQRDKALKLRGMHDKKAYY